MNKINKLNRRQTEKIFNNIFLGKMNTENQKKFLLEIHGKETAEIIVGAIRAMRNAMTKINVRDYPNEIVLDVCGTGGGKFPTFNISTTVAFVVAGCGIKVAKHGNKAVSSNFGSADVLKKLGLNLKTSPRRMAKIIKNIGVGFMFAPLYHPAMKYVAQARKELTQRTTFNILGPLCNPASADTQIIGVYKEKLTKITPKALTRLGTKHAFVLYSPKGLDEISIKGKTTVVELKDGKILPSYQISPFNFGIKEASLTKIKPGRTSKENANIILDVLSGEKSARTDIVLINSALGIVAAGKTNNLKEAVKIAQESISSGNALRKLKLLIELSGKK